MPLLKFAHDTFSPAVEEAQEEVTLDAWLENPHAHAGATILVINNDEDLFDLRCDFAGFSVIVLDFPSFADGRAYSQARLLRERYGFRGEIRARGDILRDQLFFMVRCGIDGFEMDTGDAATANDAFSEFSFAYQRAADKGEPIWRMRLQSAKAA
ncbi:MAG: DUF934 domain-containing protein [Pseudomonadota bacterium]